MPDSEQVPPEDNRLIYALLYIIENGLRELIVERLQATCGPLWYKQRLPEDILKKYREGVKTERSVKWTRCIPHHPIYYTDFASLQKIIDRADNWRDVFEPIFQNRGKAVFLSVLSGLEPVRNKIAHNRKATVQDLKLTEGAYTQLSEALGEQRLLDYASRATLNQDIPTVLQSLVEEVRATSRLCQSCHMIGATPIWYTASTSWWFDDSYLGASTKEIAAYYNLLSEYVALPRGRGLGYRVEDWVHRHSVAGLEDAAVRSIAQLLTANGVEV